MFCPVEDQYLSGRAFGGNQIRVLGHVSRLVDFSRVDDLLDDLNLRRRGDSVTTHFPPLLVPLELDIALREVNCCDLKVILGLVRGVSAEKESMDRVWLVCRSLWSSERVGPNTRAESLTIPCPGTIGTLGLANPGRG